ncbi:MAG: IS3-like element IS1141 family transposase, partial [Acidimicrobiia bacterium]
MIQEAFSELEPLVRTKRACWLLGLPRATHYRGLRPRESQEPRPRPRPANALSPAERQAVVDALHEPRFCDLPPAQCWARLLDEGTYLGSISTMYRVLRERGESRDRRRTRTHPARHKPELLARQPSD